MTNRESTPAERRQQVLDRIAETQVRLEAITLEYQAARREADVEQMRALVVEATVLQDAVPSLQCQAVAAELAVLHDMLAEATRRRDDARQPMETAIALQR